MHPTRINAAWMLIEQRASGTLNQRGSDRLSNVACGVFGGVKEQTEYRRRETGATDLAIFDERLARCRSQLLHGPIDDAIHVGDER